MSFLLPPIDHDPVQNPANHSGDARPPNGPRPRHQRPRKGQKRQAHVTPEAAGEQKRQDGLPHSQAIGLNRRQEADQ